MCVCVHVILLHFIIIILIVSFSWMLKHFDMFIVIYYSKTMVAVTNYFTAAKTEDSSFSYIGNLICVWARHNLTGICKIHIVKLLLRLLVSY